MAAGITKKFLILFVIGLGFDNSVRATENLFQSKWEILVGSKNDDQFFACSGILCIIMGEEYFLTDPHCIHNGLAETPYSQMYINEVNGGNPLLEANEINETDMYYNEDFSQIYNESGRMIMMIKLKHPKIDDSKKKEIEFINLANSSDDVDFSTCFIYHTNGRHVPLDFCHLSNCYKNGQNHHCNRLRCTFHESMIISGNIVICYTKMEPKTKVICAILSEGRHTSGFRFHHPLIEFENVSDLRKRNNAKPASLSLDGENFMVNTTTK